MTDATDTLTLTEFLLARIAEDEEAARLCAEMFPAPWDVADRGWRVRIYASDVAVEDFGSDDPDATTTRNAVVMEVEPDRNIEDPRWLSERVEHVRRHDPARVLAECEAKRRIVEMHKEWPVLVESQPEFTSEPDLDSTIFRMSKQIAWTTEQKYREHFGTEPPTGPILRALAAVYADHPDYREEWRA